MKATLIFFAASLSICVSSTIARSLHIQKRAAFYIANETACVVDSIVYYNGDPIPTDDPCEACKCRPPGFACVLRECEVKPGCRAVRKAGHCCPEYVCGCEHNGRMYRDGDEIRDSQNPCYTCHCQGSAIACAFVDCFFRVDCAPDYIPGECCPRYDHCSALANESSSTELNAVAQPSTTVLSTEPDTLKTSIKVEVFTEPPRPSDATDSGDEIKEKQPSDGLELADGDKPKEEAPKEETTVVKTTTDAISITATTEKAIDEISLFENVDPVFFDPKTVTVEKEKPILEKKDQASDNVKPSQGESNGTEETASAEKSSAELVDASEDKPKPPEESSTLAEETSEDKIDENILTEIHDVQGYHHHFSHTTQEANALEDISATTSAQYEGDNKIETKENIPMTPIPVLFSSANVNEGNDPESEKLDDSNTTVFPKKQDSKDKSQEDADSHYEEARLSTKSDEKISSDEKDDSGLEKQSYTETSKTLPEIATSIPKRVGKQNEDKDEEKVITKTEITLTTESTYSTNVRTKQEEDTKPTATIGEKTESLPSSTVGDITKETTTIPSTTKTKVPLYIAKSTETVGNSDTTVRNSDTSSATPLTPSETTEHKTAKIETSSSAETSTEKNIATTSFDKIETTPQE